MRWLKGELLRPREEDELYIVWADDADEVFVVLLLSRRRGVNGEAKCGVRVGQLVRNHMVEEREGRKGREVVEGIAGF